jgi:hypothetical protein
MLSHKRSLDINVYPLAGRNQASVPKSARPSTPMASFCPVAMVTGSSCHLGAFPSWRQGSCWCWGLRRSSYGLSHTEIWAMSWWQEIIDSDWQLPALATTFIPLLWLLSSRFCSSCLSQPPMVVAEGPQKALHNWLPHAVYINVNVYVMFFNTGIQFILVSKI